MKKKRLTNILKRVWATDKYLFIKIVLLKICNGFLPLLYIFVYASFIDHIMAFFRGEYQIQNIITSVVFMLVISLIQHYGNDLFHYCVMKYNLELLNIEKNRYLDKCCKLKYDNFEKEQVQDLIYTVQEGIPDRILSGFVNLLNCMELFIKLFSIVLVIIRYSFFSAIVILLSFIPIIKVSIKRAEDDYEAFIHYQKEERRMNSYEEMITSAEYAKERKLFGYGEWIIHKWSNAFDVASNIFLNVKKKNYFFVKKISLVIKIMFLAIIGILMLLAVRSTITIGIFVTMVTQIIVLSDIMTWSMTSYLYYISESFQYMEHYNKFYALEEEDERKETVENCETIEFKDVSFKYPGSNQYVLKHLSYIFHTNKSYAIVGENGAGKTTIMKLLLGLYDGYEGEILFNNIEIRNIKNRNIFSVMFQDFAKYEISLKENILLDCDPCSSDQVLLEQLHKLNLTINTNKEVNELHMVMGFLSNNESCVDLSIGQWQKVAMLRALNHNSSMYILDEPTASLDPASETQLYNIFRSMIDKKSSIIITHRLGAIRLVDTILVLAQGTIMESGTHQDLMNLGGLYSEMYNCQKEWFND